MSVPEPEEALHTIAQAAALLFQHGQTTEKITLTAQRLGRAFGLETRALPAWGEITVLIDRPRQSESIPVTPLGINMGKVLAVMRISDRVCDGTLSHQAVRSALAAAGGQRSSPPAPSFALIAAIGAAAMGVIFGAVDAESLLLIAASAGLGALVRHGLQGVGGNPFLQPLSAATLAGAVAGLAGRWLHQPQAQALLALCPCMIMVPGPHILNGAIDLLRTRIALGIARLAYAGMHMLMISTGLLSGLACVGARLTAPTSTVTAPFAADVIAAGCAAAAFGAAFSIPWRLLALPVAIGMLAHAARWGLIALAGAHVATGAFAACALVGTVMTLLADRLHLPFAALAFSAVVSMMPGFFLFQAAGDLVNLVPGRPIEAVPMLLTIISNGTTASLVVLAMTAGLVLPRLLLECRRPPT